jgi:predicted PurR-regulated permease PerM
MHVEQKTASLQLARVFYWLGILALLVFFLDRFRSFLQPFVIAVIFWFLITDFSQLIAKIKIKDYSLPHWLRVMIAFVLILSIIFFSVDLLSKNIELIISHVPEYRSKLGDMISRIGVSRGVENITERVQERLLAIDFQAMLREILRVLTTFIGHFFFILIYVAFLLIESTVFNKKIEQIFKTERYSEIQRLISKMSTSVNRYLSVKTLVSLLTGFFSYLVLLVFELDFPEMWAFLIFLMNFIPYIGSLVATALPALFAMFQFNSYMSFIWVFLAIETVQILMANYVEPRIMGRRLNLSPLIVILSLSFWGMLWGVVGMFLAVPLTSIILIVLSNFPSTQNVALLFSEKGTL